MKPLKSVNGYGEKHLGDKFQNLGLLGCGSYGEVYKVRHRETQKIYAIKIYRHVFANRIIALRVLREVMILRSISHNRIIKIYDILAPDNLEEYDSLSVVLEYLPFDLHRLIQKNLYLKDKHIPKIIYQILIALKYLSHMNILHRDLKPQNILSDQNFNIKICDFGLARPGVCQKSFSDLTKQPDSYNAQPEPSALDNSFYSPVPKRKQLNMLTCHVVSRWYRAPELILMQTKYDSSIEMWAVGCILGEIILEHEKNKVIKVNKPRKALFTGKACFPLSPPKKEHAKLYKVENGFPQSEDDQLSKIFQLIGSPSEDDTSFITEQLVSNYIKSLPKYPKKKPKDLFQYCRQEWEDFLEKTLVFDPRKRMHIDQAIQHPLFDSVRNPDDLNFGEGKDLNLFLPSDLSIPEIKQQLKRQILIYQNKDIVQINRKKIVTEQDMLEVQHAIKAQGVLNQAREE